MTFRKITFSFIAILLSSLIALQYWMIQSYTGKVSSKIGEAAFEVSRSTIETILFKQPQIEFRRFAVSANTRVIEHTELINSISTTPQDINIKLNDGNVDNFITLDSSGASHKIDIPRTGIENSIENMTEKLLMSAIIFILIGLFLANSFSKKISKPLKKLQIASEHIGNGEFGYQIKTIENNTATELQNSINAFNKMSKEIAYLQQENERLEKRNQLSEISEITRGLAHTIRNPLNTLSLAVDELSGSEEHSDKQELAKISKHQISRIDKWVRSLMEIMTTDKALIEDLDLRLLLQECIDDLLLGTRSEISIVLNGASPITDDSVFKIAAIRTELKSLLQGLIGNAVESVESYLEQSKNNDLQDRSRINVNLFDKGGTYNIVVEDLGVGFSPEIKAKLFSPHNTNKTYGAGMGLYLAHRIVSLNYQGSLLIDDNRLPIDEPAKNKEPQVAGAKLTITLNNRI